MKPHPLARSRSRRTARRAPSLPALLGVLLMIGAAPWLACASRVAGPIGDCEPEGNARPICGFTNPEDMVALPGDQAILIGEYGRSAEDHSGGLVVFTLEDEQRRVVFEGGDSTAEPEAGWGDPTCTSPPTRAFNSHGIDLVRRDDGRWQLLVVQHGGREAIEFFELQGEGTRWQVEWRGCVRAPEDASLNEVVALPDGRFYTTRMASLRGALELERGLPTEPTGHAFVWSAEEGYRKIEGTEGIMPNGIASSPDGRILYMNASGEGSLRKVEVASGRELGRAAVPMPDNVTWSPDGRLLVASLGGLDPSQFEACQTMEKGACPIPFQIIAVDPDTMTPLGPVYQSDGSPMGAGTVGLQVGNELFIGSFQGDRILRVTLDPG
ncbi:MAG: SMP-30/gluconolactonase/LRE family protein [bacterium]